MKDRARAGGVRGRRKPFVLRSFPARVDVGVDVGGTFTDFVAFRGRDVVALKLPTSRDPADAVSEGMRSLGGQALAHGTTVATNAILERKGARTAFVTTAGFEDRQSVFFLYRRENSTRSLVRRHH